MFIEKVRNTIKKYKLIDKGDKLIVGVSGGADSLALLYCLNKLKEEFRFSLYIAHLDHMLRKDSYKDREFVEGLAKKLKIPFTSTAINVKAPVKKGSLEEVARNARQQFFFKIARDINADKIALGHNLDDQAETVLMRLIRGSGLYGLAGILPKRQFDDICVIRPLIKTKRKEIEAFLKKRKIKPRVDWTNKQDIYFRNKIRNNLLPLLEREYNKNIKEVLSNTAESAGFDYDYLNREAVKTAKLFGVKIDLDEFVKLHPAIQRLVLRLNIARLKGDTRRISFKHIEEISDLVFNRPVNSIVDLPKRISVIKKKKSLFFYRKVSI